MRARPQVQIVLVLLAMAVGIAVGVASRPAVSAVLGRMEVERAFEELPIPATWIRGDLHLDVLDDGSVLLVAPYEVGTDHLGAIRNFVEDAAGQGWRRTGGNPDLSTALLQKGDLRIGLAVLTRDLPMVRLELARYR